MLTFILSFAGFAAAIISLILLACGSRFLADEFDAASVSGLASAAAVVGLVFAGLGLVDVTGWAMTLILATLTLGITVVLLTLGAVLSSQQRQRRKSSAASDGTPHPGCPTCQCP